jgi:3'-phosphoadenosine 5'-phosphosulfate sulfotransferase (PAPS reductase)/FAD synthetase
LTNPYLIEAPAVISFSGGRTSGYMLHKIVEAFSGKLPDGIHVVFANTGREMPQTLDFVRDCGEHFGVHIDWLEYDPARKFNTTVVSYDTAARGGSHSRH